MFKYMKYEIRVTYRYILGVLALVLALTAALYYYIGRPSIETSNISRIFVALSVLILFGTGLSTFLYIVGSFRKELYEDTGYLIFTLPLTGNQIVGAKLVVASLWFIALGVIIGIYNIALVLIFAPAEVNISELFSRLFDIISIRHILFFIISSIFSIVNMLVIVYFSMAISRVTFRNKRIGGMWFIIFIVISAVFAYSIAYISATFPYYIDLDTFKIGTMDKLNRFYMEFNDSNITIGANTSGLTINIAATIYSIVATAGLFLATGYLIDKKIDL